MRGRGREGERVKGKRKKEQWRERGGGERGRKWVRGREREKVGERRRRRLGKAKWEGSSTIIYWSFFRLRMNSYN